jgi:Domain of unknown function (DUF4145)
MSILIYNCSRCQANRVTFDVIAQIFRHSEYGWKHWFETCCVCRNCSTPSLLLISLTEYEYSERFFQPNAVRDFEGSLSPLFKVERLIGLREHVSMPPPDLLPEQLRNAFMEGATCHSAACYNAAGTMFRLCIDLVTRPLLPDPNDASKEQPNSRQRRDLGLRLPWMFDHGILPNDLRELAICVKEDGNDGAHAGTLTKEEAEDLADFTFAFLNRLVSEPERVKRAAARRDERRQNR